jgi:hypothetical protein
VIRNELDVLLDKVQDPALRADLRSQIDRLKQRRSFGLVFEHHIPERVRLPQHPIRVGSQVVSRDDDDGPTFEVILIEDGVATLVPVRDASIVDPHGDYLADARAKLEALADFAGRFADQFVRIESVAKVDDGTLRVLDLADSAVRNAVLAFQGGKVTALYQSEQSRPYL